jgi:hypothetical protein
MNNFALLGTVPVTRLLMQLKTHPEYWNLYRERTESYESPHAGVSDIWIRYRDRNEFNGSWSDFAREPHDCIWYPAADALSAVKDIAFELMAWVRGERLGGILITRIPAGGAVLPHIDDGYNAKAYEKFAVILESAPGQAMYYEEGAMSGDPGSVFWFKNDVTHWVKNESAVDRITLIVSIQPEGRALCHSEQL